MADTLHVATRKGLFTLNRNDAAWSVTNTAFLGAPVTATVASEDGQFILAALNHGHFGTKMQRSIDGGKTWEESAVPTYPEMPEGHDPVKCPMRGTPIPWKLEQVWILQIGGDGAIWCGTLPGGMFVSRDRGDSWQFIDSLWNLPNRAKWFGGGYDVPGIHSICVHPDNPNDLTIAISCGGVWHSGDAGETWELYGEGLRAEYMPPEQAGEPDTQDAHYMVSCKSKPNGMWIQHHNGIFRSTDAGRNWNEIKSAGPSTFGFAVAVHPDDPDIAWFAPAVKDEERVPVDGKVVITRTRDGGQSFDTLRSGLPQEHAYDLIFRHALDIDATGNRLAFGSTTGSVWTTEDQGDAWQHVSAHLPPVYALRFVK